VVISELQQDATGMEPFRIVLGEWQDNNRRQRKKKEESYI
jgi:hypothetical protein